MRSKLRSICDGFTLSAAFLNFYSGDSSLGDRIMNWTMPNGPADNSWYFVGGLFTEVLCEAGAITGSFYTDNPMNYLLINASIKTVPRMIDIGISNLSKIIKKHSAYDSNLRTSKD